jgi:hypothetical protein
MATNGQPQASKPAEEKDPDSLLDELENEDDNAYRAQRLQQLQSEAKAAATSTKLDEVYVTLPDDDSTLRFTTEHERAVVHFFHPDFARCATMDTHVREIASKHSELGVDVAFGRVDVQNCPFLVEKLGIRVLPCLLGFAKGVVKGRTTGFEGVSWEGRESGVVVTGAVEGRLVEWGVLRKRLVEVYDEDEEEDEEKEKEKEGKGRRGIKGRKQRVEDEDDDWD